ncbi:3-deoxy-D-manno-octulosonic acid transferase [Alcaligenaceae bacterium CGII-47]|nr:3-deoxy-D-manno-octulosonic acid transferase [Alcaligenaceae bacterium CGII-47]
MNRFLYTLVIRLLTPGLLIWMALRARRAGGDWGVCSGERFAWYGRAAPNLGGSDAGALIWIHAVSLGETRAAQPLVRALLDKGHRILFTHMTVTGRDEGQRAFGAEIAQGRVAQAWLPYDFPGAVRRFLAYYQPRAGVLIEREIWPNLVHAAYCAQIPLVLASARMSDAALRQSLRSGSVMREAYGRFSGVYAQSLQDAQRLEQAGAAAVRVSGNFKFDIHLDAEKVARGSAFAARLGRKVIAIASTREGEDALFIAALQHQISRARAQGNELVEHVLFYLIPRHPVRFDEAAAQLDAAGLAYVRRTHLLALGDDSSTALHACQDVCVLLGDTLGEMPWYYAGSQIAIVGGSFEPLGGQNFIEASALGVPVLVGMHTQHFEQAVFDASQAGAIERVASPHEAVQRALQWLDDPSHRTRMGAAGEYWVQQHMGAVERVVDGLEGLL